MKKRFSVFVFGFILFIFALSVGAQIQSQEGILVDQRTQWVAIVTDSSIIRLIADAFYISEEKISKLEVIDTNNNGFSRGDLIKTFPSEEIYFLDEPGEQIQKVMDAWKFQANYHVTIENTQTPEMLEKIPVRKAEYGIVASFLKGLQRNYRDWPLKVWIERDSLGLNFQMWGYSESALNYTPPPPAGYDIVTFYKTVYDTLFIPLKSP